MSHLAVSRFFPIPVNHITYRTARGVIFHCAHFEIPGGEGGDGEWGGGFMFEGCYPLDR